MIVTPESSPELFRFLTDRNLLAQYDFLERSVKVAIDQKLEGVDPSLVRELNRIATMFISRSPGAYRECWVGITNSDHVPPEHAQVSELMRNLHRYLFDNWQSATPLHLAAYALWTINWVHPFEEGNGRTARACCQYVLCVKFGIWLPGRNIIPQQIRADRSPYYEALRDADRKHRDTGAADVSALESYLDRLLAEQLRS